MRAKDVVYAHRKLGEDMNIKSYLVKMILLRFLHLSRLISSFNLSGGGNMVSELALIGSLVRIGSININVSSAAFVAITAVLAGTYFGYQLIEGGRENLGFALVAMSLLFSLGILLIEKLS